MLAHGSDFIDKRLAPAEPANDGKQTPMRGHPASSPSTRRPRAAEDASRSGTLSQKGVRSRRRRSNTYSTSSAAGFRRRTREFVRYNRNAPVFGDQKVVTLTASRRKAGSMVIPNPGPEGTRTVPFSHLSDEVSLLTGMSESPLNSVNGTGLGMHEAKWAASR